MIDALESEPSAPRSGQFFFWFSLALVTLLALGLILFVVLRLVPDIRRRAELNLQVAEARDNLAAAEQLIAALPARYQAQRANAETRLSQAAANFLTETQPARLLDRLNGYSRAAGVEIIDLQIQPTPSASPGADVYSQRVFALRASGTFDDLLDFLARVKEVALPGLVLSELKIAPDPGGSREGLHVLSMKVSMYTSVYATAPKGFPPPDASAEAQTEETTTAASPIPLASPDELAELQIALDTAWAENDWASAVEDATQILSLLPENQDVIETLYRAHVNYGYHLLAKRRIPEAAAQFNAALAVKPTGREALDESQQLASNSALVYTAEEQLVEALQSATEAGDWKEVIRLLRLIQTVNPQYEGLNDLLYTAYMSYGAQLEAEGKPDLAQEQFNQARVIQESQESSGGATSPGRPLGPETSPTTTP